MTFENHDGSFTIYKQCRGPHSWGDQNKTVGPGYIAKALRFNGDGTTMLILDDVRPQISSDGSNGGLGTFALQAARGTMGSVLSPSNAWRIEGRECAADSWIDPRPAQFPYATNRGVSAQQVISGPTQVTGGIDFTIDVTLRDPYAGAPPPCPSSADSVRVRYHYVIGDTQIKVWTTATRLNPNYTSSCSYNGFIKEPKLVFNIGRPDADLFHRTDYYRLYVFDTNGYLGQNQVNYKGGVGFNCFWNGKNPDPRRGSASTGQCDANKRLAARFDFGSVQEAASSGDDGGCPKFPTDTCLYIVARSVATPDSATTYNWEKACTYDAVTCPFRGFGLDGWEHKGWGDRESKQCCAPSTRQFNTVDFPDDKGNISKCVDRATLPEEWLRRWELAGGPQNQQQPGGKFDPLPYEKAAFLFKGWDGGGGSYDCEPSSWAETTSSPSWGNYFSLTFGSEYTY